MNKPFVSVIIPTYKDWPRLKLCLEALAKQTYPAESFGVIVVNNDPYDTCPYQLPANNMKIITEAKPGSYAARNTGIKHSRGEIIAFTDSDCIPDNNWILNAINIFNNKKPDLIGGIIELFKENEASKLAYIYEKNYAFRQHINVPKGNGVTANLFVQKYVIDKIGSFNSNINSGGDWEFTQNCVKNGYVLKYYDNIKILHPARKSIFNILQKHYRFVGWGFLNQQRKTNKPLFEIFLILLYSEVKNLLKSDYPPP